MYALCRGIPVPAPGGRPLTRPGLPLLLLTLLVALLGSSGSALAAAGAWAENEHSRVRLITESEATGEEAELRAGLQFEMAPGWKTYWRSPGDAGYPVSVDWSASENLADVSFNWPVPHRFELFGLDTFGYDEEVVFPLTLVPERPGEPIRLAARVDYLLCETICIPYEEDVRLTLPAGTATPGPEAFLIDLYRSQLPQPEAESGLSLSQVGFSERDGLTQLTARAETLFAFTERPDLLVEGPDGLHFGRPEVRLSDDRLRADFTVPVNRQGDAEAEGAPLRLTLVDGSRGHEMETRLRPTEGTGSGALPAEGRSLALILGLALLGGLILNLMPCVLPVLSLKLLSLVKHGGGAPRAVRLSFLATAAGILASFLVLAAGAIALKAGGAAVGWGIQFQQPVFLAGMALVVTLFAANLFGFFEIPLPGAVADQATRTPTQGLGGAFATGAFATLLATPCSAPFLGTAVGFALSRGAPEILLIFTALGLGLALPYLLVAAWPRLATALPRPGAWMVWLRRLLGLALIATALWLLSVLAVQLGLAGALLLGALLATLLAVFALGRLLPARRTLLRASALLVALAVLGFAAYGPAADGSTTTRSADQHWQSFDRQEIAAAVAKGQTVLVDVTADWCITCQVNKARVLDDERIEAMIADETVLALRADWTRPNAEIAAYLADHGRYGIPFNAVYGPAARQGILLPELLSVEGLRQALEQASGSAG
ncbi:protein-disulfide reductase DsbD family protein [Aquibaculum arenosum]|uniref:Protein-disulfide reductase DsbD family protein n=1 Tax=Aquibaculum arenosum TaxID=3032591 RepID=A0ABT5YQ76_9PROT|nr:protein-disulfide reductase DsbD domain-containing protein [Fodinicurvata sp. CAU 1616]MDF2097114.1 protein-disulfide reductase DsbD family protein [Fodinicurvata sp. CAU 1616]